MSQLGDLYQELIIDHSKRPRNFGPLPEANHQAEGFNRMCGDRVTVMVELEGERVRQVRFQGSGCAISTASASLLTEAVKGKTRAEAEALFQRFHALVTGVIGKDTGQGNGQDAAPAAGVPELGKLAVFSGVSEYPARVKCASLAWHTLHAALTAPAVESAPESVSTE
ncbi:MAG TPA: SUF system NifU family Fe-S cluster assembly protein [Terriglobales bacterium]|nr:SUF system NifU family Fe-S cluster assembly protein [Terriglobales bacterium]